MTIRAKISRHTLAFRYSLQASTHHFRHIGCRKQCYAYEGAQQLVEINPFGKEERQYDGSHEQHGDQGNATPELDEDNRHQFDNGQLGSPAERQKDADRQRNHNAGDGNHQCDEQTAPAICRHFP